MKSTDHERSLMAAVTFAEAGDWDTARWYAPPRPRGRGWLAWIERHLVAACFAEAGLPQDALRLLEAPTSVPVPRQRDPLEALLRGRGVRMLCGVLSPAALTARR